jgi:hypothetical protein
VGARAERARQDIRKDAHFERFATELILHASLAKAGVHLSAARSADKNVSAFAGTARLRDRHIGDFRQWTRPAEYQKSLERLLRDLKASENA